MKNSRYIYLLSVCALLALGCTKDPAPEEISRGGPPTPQDAGAVPGDPDPGPPPVESTPMPEPPPIPEVGNPIDPNQNPNPNPQ